MQLAENSFLCRDDFEAHFKAAVPTEASILITAVYSSALWTFFHQNACKLMTNQKTNITTSTAVHRQLHTLRSFHRTSLGTRQERRTRSPPHAFVQTTYRFAVRSFVVCSSGNCMLFYMCYKMFILHLISRESHQVPSYIGL